MKEKERPSSTSEAGDELKAPRPERSLSEVSVKGNEEFSSARVMADTASPFSVSTPQPENPENSGEGHKHSTAEPVVMNLPGPSPSMSKSPTPPMPKSAEKKQKAPSDQAKPTSEGPESAKTVTPDILLQPVLFEMGDPNETDEQRPARVHAFYEKRGPEYRQAMMRKYLPDEDKGTEPAEVPNVPTKEELAIRLAIDGPVSAMANPALKRKRSVSPQQKMYRVGYKFPCVYKGKANVE